MFVGHYGVSYAAKAVSPGVRLWVLFIAVQLVDIAWAILVLLGVERVRIVPGITATNPLDLYYMPYTHSLVASILWAGGAALAYRVWRGSGRTRATVVIGLAVLSHWVLDLVVHRPDLPIYDDALKVGLGLWNLPLVALAVEAGLLFGGILLYRRSSVPVAPAGRYAMIVLGVLMVAAQIGVFFGPPPESSRAIASLALGSYVLFAAAVAWLERLRRQHPEGGGPPPARG